jgi:ribonuclease-3
MTEQDIQRFKEFSQKARLGFADVGLLATALTHRSYVNEHRGEVKEHNERLEFLGDAVLELAVTEVLFKRYPEKPEGDLTAYRAALVNTDSLADAAQALGVNEYLRLSKGEAKDTGRARRFILANAFEAIIGALYLDRGYDAARSFIERTLVGKLDEIVAKRLWQDAKSRFQERAQAYLSTTPRYEALSESGPDHDKWFVVGVYVGAELVAEGEGKSKQEAEQAAAQHALIAKGW